MRSNKSLFNVVEFKINKAIYLQEETSHDCK